MSAVRLSKIPDFIGKFLKFLDKCRTMTIHSLHVSLLSCQLIVDSYFASSSFVQYAYLHTIAETSHSVDQNNVDILDEAVGFNVVVRNIVLDVLDAAIITYNHVVQADMEQARVLVNAAWHCEGFFKVPDATFA